MDRGAAPLEQERRIRLQEEREEEEEAQKLKKRARLGGLAPLGNYATFVLLGDSITQQGSCEGGWVQLLTNRYIRRADVLNRGHSGYNTRWAAPVLEGILARSSEPAALWTVWLGANDAATPASHRQHVPVDEYAANLKAFVHAIQESAAGTGCRPPSIVVITPPPVDDAKWLACLRQRNPAIEESDRTDAIAGTYAQAAREVAARCGVELLDLYTVMHSQQQPPAHFLSDGLHLNGAGNELTYQALVKLIDNRLPWLAVQPDQFTGAWHNSGSSSPLQPAWPWHDEISAKPPYHAAFGEVGATSSL